jgi:hypothetical protein
MFVGALVVMVVDQIFVDWMKKENSQTTNDE